MFDSKPIGKLGEIYCSSIGSRSSVELKALQLGEDFRGMKGAVVGDLDEGVLVFADRLQLGGGIGGAIFEGLDLILEALDRATDVGIDAIVEASNFGQTELEVLQQASDICMGSVAPC